MEVFISKYKQWIMLYYCRFGVLSPQYCSPIKQLTTTVFRTSFLVTYLYPFFGYEWCMKESKFYLNESICNKLPDVDYILQPFWMFSYHNTVVLLNN